MRIIGGEAELKDEDMFHYLTDSGRSSLRLILKSGMKKRKFLLPDYLCGIIPQIFDQCGVKYEYYRINRDLSADMYDIGKREFDAIYIINYFGRRNALLDQIAEMGGALVVEDSVFSPIIIKPKNANQWIGFNSFRKASFVPEGSMLFSTLELRQELIQKGEAPFIHLKYAAKQMKHEYLNKRRHSQNRYLKLFKEAENKLDLQKGIHSVSARSLNYLFKLFRGYAEEYNTRKSNLQTLDRCLNKVSVKLLPDYPSFYLLDVDCRDGLRKYLISKRIFLPVHWPEIRGVNNVLYKRVLSIPVDSRYGTYDMKTIAGHVLRFLNKRAGRRS
jgi:hypothetical protein